MNHQLPIRAALANRFIAGAVASTRTPLATRLTAMWEQGGAAFDLGPLAAFNGGTSFAGTYAALTLAWPAEINPRTPGTWRQRIVPGDAARITVSMECRTATATATVPLLKAVPVPDGAQERYGGPETLEIRLQDVTGIAGRTADYPLPPFETGTADARAVATQVLSPVPYVCLYATGPVDGCVERFPNALMAADDVLVRQQDAQNPLAGRKRIRYGDRGGAIVYRAVEDPAAGAPFAQGAAFSQFDFEYGPRQISALSLEGRYLSVTTPFINPYLELASRIRLAVPYATLDEIVEIHGMRWAANPGSQTTTLKCRRQYTL